MPGIKLGNKALQPKKKVKPDLALVVDKPKKDKKAEAKAEKAKSKEPVVFSFTEGMFLIDNSPKPDKMINLMIDLAKLEEVVEPLLLNVSKGKYTEFIDNNLARELMNNMEETVVISDKTVKPVGVRFEIL